MEDDLIILEMKTTPPPPPRDARDDAFPYIAEFFFTDFTLFAYLKPA